MVALQNLEETKQFYLYINFSPNLRGLRVGLCYTKCENRVYGYYLGYGGGAIFEGYYFQLTESGLQFKDLEKSEEARYWGIEEEGESLKKVSKTERIMLEKTSTHLFNYIELVEDEGYYYYKLIEEKIPLFEKTTEEEGYSLYLLNIGEVALDLLVFLSANWCLLSYFENTITGDIK